ncbi:uncharacterized protein LOC105703534 isoform X4 [Orussus abietinus]|uniref:uncharacterized protein LOC105703534 isoform X4 n=1 Tax=Orussus abietinus TaxID=222816 RepID=UPI0006259498|nr:uncharacterized protein LOC105703534 isoform X4 [Orussus abietinus]
MLVESEERDSIIPQALKLIQLFEKHPPSEKCAGCDFSEAYKFLYDLTVGNNSTDCPSATKEMIYCVIARIKRDIWPSTNKQILDQLCRLDSKTKAVKVYPGKKKGD